MAGDDRRTTLELPTAISLASRAIATILYCREDERVKRRCEQLGKTDVRTLKRNLAQIPYEIGLIRSHQVQLKFFLDTIAANLNDILDRDYIEGFEGDNNQVFSSNLARHDKLANFAAILTERPRDFEDVMAIRTDASIELSNLATLLKKFSDELDNLDPEEAETSYETTSKRKFPDPHISTSAFPNIKGLVETLHDILHKHWPCQVTHHDHAGTLGQCNYANMQLDPQWIIQGANDGQFFIILTGTGINQECKIHLSKPIANGADGELLCLLRYEECKECCLFLVSDTSGKLWESDEISLDLQLHIQNDPRRPAQYKLLSLKELLQGLEPSYPAKRVVGMILARSLLVLLHGPWVGNSLSMEDVSVFCRFDSEEPRPFFDKIFISTRFGSSINTLPSRRQRNAHPFPAIQALGILIAEIELGDDLAGIYRDVPPKDKINKPGQIATMLLKESQKRLPLGAGVLRAIKFCIERSSFEKYVYSSTPGSLQEDLGFVTEYYLNIVRPLEEDLVVGANWSWDEINGSKCRELDDSGIAKIITSPAVHEIQPQFGGRRKGMLPGLQSLKESEYVPEYPLHLRHSSQSQPQVDVDVVFDAGSCVLASNDVSLSTDFWFAELEDVHKNLNRDRMDSLSEDEVEELVKVAVIDTGIDLSHPEFQTMITNGQLDPGIDFVDEGKRVSDTDGHGTHICHILFKTAPYVKLYPMRVFRTSKREDTTPILVKKAIYHAIEEWDVDIISMSFAFEEEELAIKDALYNAKSKNPKNVLMFAAASNNRSLRADPIGYPARAKDRVICVNSSTVYNKRSNFSPEGVLGQANFSAVGENVEAAWPICDGNRTNETLKRLSGTSCATPIVAGIAAMILDFSKKEGQELSALKKWDVKKQELWETVGMRSVLKRCMTDMKTDGSYNFLKPWKLLKEPDFQAIAVKIIDALESKYTWG